jgi:ribosomal protein L40E
MPEALTESFCERCGTRYEFAAPTQLNTIRKTRGLISGLKNYIMSQDALGDAVGDAMRSEEAALASEQLDAFHQSFNFCITCRQYTCVNCWNESAGRCRTCVPIPGTDDLLERFEATFHAGHADLATNGAGTELDDAEIQRRLGVEAWPETDLPAAQPMVEEPLLAAEVEEPTVEPMVEEPLLAAEVEEPTVEPMVEEPLLAAEVALPTEGLTWEDDATWELLPAAEVEEPTVEPMVEEPLLAAEVETPTVEPMVEEPLLAAEVEPTVEPMVEEPLLAAEVEERTVEPTRPTEPIRPISETIIRLPRPTPVQPAVAEDDRIAAAAHADEDPAAAARREQLELLGLGDPGEGPVSAARPNVLPYRSRGAAPGPAELAALGETAPAVSRGFWDASAREVAAAMTQVGVQSCGECGLSLSASARFCRRCGTRQARSA